MAAAIEPIMITATSELEELFRAQHTRVLKAAYRVTGSMADAEDVAQNVFLRIAQQGVSRSAIDNPDSYVYRAAINGALDLLRKRRREQPVALEDVPELSAPPSAGHREADELRRRLRSALADLSPRASEMFVLHYLEDYDNHEIARMLNTSRAAVGVVLFRTRARLRRTLRAEIRGKQ